VTRVTLPAWATWALRALAGGAVAPQSRGGHLGLSPRSAHALAAAARKGLSYGHSLMGAAPRRRRRSAGGARSARSVSRSRGSSSSGSEAQWGEARRAALSADRAAADAAWGQHEAEENDVGALRWKAVRRGRAPLTAALRAQGMGWGSYLSELWMRIQHTF